MKVRFITIEYTLEFINDYLHLLKRVITTEMHYLCEREKKIKERKYELNQAYLKYLFLPISASTKIHMEALSMNKSSFL